METYQSVGEPDPKRPKIESEGSTSAKPKAIDPFLSLPSDILVKIIAYTPIAQWPSLESLDENFRAATLIAWRQLRNIKVDREFSMEDDTSVRSCLEKLVERSPILTSMSGVDIRSDDAAMTSDAVQLLAKFEHLQSITMGDVCFSGDQAVTLENLIELLESTRSRASLKELRLYDVGQPDQEPGELATIIDRFASSFVNVHGIHSPSMLEKFTYTVPSEGGPWYFVRPLYIRLDTMDTTRLTDVRLGKATIEPEQLTNLIERASNLHRIELSFIDCNDDCTRHRKEPNKKLLTALAHREHLTAIKFDCINYMEGCGCLCFSAEFIEMLKTIGQRGTLRKLATGESFTDWSNTEEICATIRIYLPYLQSLKIFIKDGSDGDDVNIFNNISALTELEELHLSLACDQVSSNVIKKIVQLPRLKRLEIDALSGVDYSNSLGWLVASSTLTDLRIRTADSICAEVFNKWSDGFASSLEILMLGCAEISEDLIDRDEKALAGLLEKATRLRVLIIENQRITDQTLKAIAKSCPKLETLGVRLASNETAVQYLQEIVDRCPRLKRLGGVDGAIRMKLQLQKYRKLIDDVDMEFWRYDFDDDEYD